MRWWEKVAMECPAPPYLAARPAPLSAAAILLAEDDMSAGWAADAWARVLVGMRKPREGGGR